MIIFVVLVAFFSVINVFADECNSNDKICFEIYSDDIVISLADINEFNQRATGDAEITVYFKIKADFSNYYFINSSQNKSDSILSLKTFRNGIKQYVTTNYNGIIDTNLDIEYSLYSPYAYCVFHDYDDYHDSISLIAEIEDDENVEKIIVAQSMITNNSSYGNLSPTDRYDFDDALNDVGLVSSNYDASDINIGIWEANEYGLIGGEVAISKFGFVDSSLMSFQNRTIVYNERDLNISNVDLSEHASVVGIISAGNQSLANNSNIFSSNIDNFVDDLDWFVDNDVVLINCSFGTISQTNTYTFLDSLIDYYSRFLGMIFCVSAGNSSEGFSSPGYVGSPANSLNVISVGAFDYLKNVAYFSSTISFNSTKPTLVAPGARLANISNDCPCLDTYFETSLPTNSGTSFSAPIVTGIIALLLDEFPTLIGHSEK